MGYSESEGDEMIKCVCDICKTEFKSTDHQTGTMTLKVYDSNHYSWPNGWRFDLCKACIKKFEKLLKKK